YFSEDRLSVLIPLSHGHARFHALTFLHLENSSIEEPMVFTLTSRVIHHHDLAVTVHDNGIAIFSGNQIRTADTDGSFMAQLALVSFDLSASSRSTDVEGTHGELRSWFTDRLGSNNAHCFSDVHAITTSEVAAVA